MDIDRTDAILFTVICVLIMFGGFILPPLLMAFHIIK